MSTQLTTRSTSGLGATVKNAGFISQTHQEVTLRKETLMNGSRPLK